MIYMAGIDYTRASIAQREQFSFVAGQVTMLLEKLYRHPLIDGCVLLATCNRTELYVSAQENVLVAERLCEAAGVPYAASIFRSECGEAAERYLMEVASGLHSQI